MNYKNYIINILSSGHFTSDIIRKEAIKITMPFIALLLLLIIYAPQMSYAIPVVGKCSAACDCVEDAMVEGDKDKNFPVNLEDKNSNYEVKEVGEAELDPKNPEAVVVIEEWSKTPEEISNDLFEALSPELKLYYRFLENFGSSNGQKDLPKSNFPGYWERLVAQGHATGPYCIQKLTGPLVCYFAIEIKDRRCFFASANQPAQTNVHTLKFCIPKNWENNNPRHQLETYLDDGSSITFAVNMMDFVVGMTPFLGSADLVFNQKILTDVFEGRMDKMAEICGSVAGDVFMMGKVLNVMKASVNTGKIVQAATFTTGCGSVVFTGGYLWQKSKNGGLGAGDYGAAAFASIELISLIVDRPAQDLIKAFVKRRFFQRKKPAATCLACGPKCETPNGEMLDIDLKTNSLTEIAANTTCPNASCLPAKPIPFDEGRRQLGKWPLFVDQAVDKALTSDIGKKIRNHAKEMQDDAYDAAQTIKDTFSSPEFQQLHYENLACKSDEFMCQIGSENWGALVQLGHPKTVVSSVRIIDRRTGDLVHGSAKAIGVNGLPGTLTGNDACTLFKSKRAVEPWCFENCAEPQGIDSVIEQIKDAFGGSLPADFNKNYEVLVWTYKLKTKQVPIACLNGNSSPAPAFFTEYTGEIEPFARCNNCRQWCEADNGITILSEKPFLKNVRVRKTERHPNLDKLE